MGEWLKSKRGISSNVRDMEKLASSCRAYNLHYSLGCGTYPARAYFTMNKKYQIIYGGCYGIFAY